MPLYKKIMRFAIWIVNLINRIKLLRHSITGHCKHAIHPLLSLPTILPGPGKRLTIPDIVSRIYLGQNVGLPSVYKY